MPIVESGERPANTEANQEPTAARVPVGNRLTKSALWSQA